jgi:MoxR-like ATPase
MQEYRVTAGGTTYELDRPFHVFATQNPIEQEGTYPLPEAQLDRFMFQINVDYPSEEEEVQIVQTTTVAEPPELDAVIWPQEILRTQALVRKVPVSDYVVRHAVRIVRASRPREGLASKNVQRMVNWGAGPRASQYLILGAKARAILHGRFAASCEDVEALAVPVLQHRIIINFHAEAEGITSRDIIAELVTAAGKVR